MLRTLEMSDDHTIRFPPLAQFSRLSNTLSGLEAHAWLEWIESLPQSVDLRTRSYDLLNIRADIQVLDVGCGIGRAVEELAARRAHAIGIDIDAQLVSHARARFPNGDYRVMSAEAMHFPDQSLDAYRAEGVFQHLDNPLVAAQEARRVLKPGGRIAVLDQDCDMWVLDTDNEPVLKAIRDLVSRSSNNGRIARHLGRLLTASGFDAITVDLYPVVHSDFHEVALGLTELLRICIRSGAVTQVQGSQWLLELAHRSEHGSFLMVVPFFVAAGTRPA
jgi:ubiquinone/menaquinone biosynthesis C-methylase UbiE